MADESISDAIKEFAGDGVRRARGDQGDVELYDLDDLIAADKYACDKAAAKKKLGLKAMVIQRAVPPGAV